MSAPISDLPSGRGAGLLVIALLATVATALAFVDAAVTPSGARSQLESLPGFFALFGLAASAVLAMLARLVRILLGRAHAVPQPEKADGGDRA